MPSQLLQTTPSNWALLTPNPNPVVCRPIAEFKPSPWGNQFLDYTLDDHEKAIEGQQELAKELKEEIKKELLSLGERPLVEQLCLIDSIERLGVAYQFEKEIDDILQRVHEKDDATSEDVFLTSLRFRILRQHGFTVSCDVFKGFIGSDGSLKDEVASDVQGLLSLYEACHVRGHGENILDEALSFTTTKLNSVHGHPLKERVSHALKKPLHKRMTRLECVHHMQDPCHNSTLLRFAKLDFNLLQSSQKKELSDMSRWWKRIDLSSKLPSRDRIVEAYFWASAVYFEPQSSIGRKICTMACQLMTSVDDIYDAYATLDELEIFTKAVNRWDKSCLDELPEYMKPYYQCLILDAFDEMERDLAAKGRSQYVYYAREEMKALCQSYLLEAKWRQRKYVPTLDEYLENAVRTSTFGLTTIFTFLDMDMATHEDFEWVRELPKPVEAICLLLRLLDDIGGHKFDKERDHASSSIDCYMRQFGVSSEIAREEIQKKADEVWKDINQAMIPPTEVPMPLLKCVLNLGRSVEAIYDGGQDGFTSINQDMKENITNLYINPIPM